MVAVVSPGSGAELESPGSVPSEPGPSVFGDPPSGLPRFDKGCKHLWENILGLFSAVIVMAKNFNDGEDVINLI